MFAFAERLRNVAFVLIDWSMYFSASSQFLSAAKVFAACMGKTPLVGFAAISASVFVRHNALTSFTSIVKGTFTLAQLRFAVAVSGVTESNVYWSHSWF